MDATDAPSFLAEQHPLWEKLQAFQFDKPGIAFTFTQRLARENGWSPLFASHVVDEYRRFLFLVCVSEKGATPSEAVDQVWHLHLTYTRSYWEELCRNTLEREIHHNPTEGGGMEGMKYFNLYNDTMDQIRSQEERNAGKRRREAR